MAKYALLLAGCVDHQFAYPRYANDLGFMYYTLTSKYDYKKDNINLLYKNGEKIRYLNLLIDTKEASIDNVERILEYYSNTLTKDDQLLVMISNHGDEIDTYMGKMAIINLWGQNDVIYQNYLLTKLDIICASKLLLFGQCYGGNFLETPIKNSIMISANFEHMVSYCNTSKNYDEFFYHFISYFNGEYPDNGQAVLNNKLTIEDAFYYAKNNDLYRKPMPLNDGTIRFQVPQIVCNGIDFDKYTL